MKKNDLHVADEQYGVDVLVSIFVDQDKVEAVQNKIINLLQNRISISVGDSHFNEVPYEN